MERIRALFSQSEFHLLLFFLGLFLLNWPLIAAFQQDHPLPLLVYLFLIWGSLIVILFLIRMSLGASGDQPAEEGQEDNS